MRGWLAREPKLLSQPQHFSDYGFDPQIDYFQVLEEARKHKRETTSKSIDALHFKLQKPISKEDSKKKNKKKWWRNALHFWRKKWVQNEGSDIDTIGTIRGDNDEAYIRRRSSNRAYMDALSGPLYITESRSGSTTPCRTRSGPLAAGTLMTPMPYVSLRELNMLQQQQEQAHRISTSSIMPIYLVT